MTTTPSKKNTVKPLTFLLPMGGLGSRFSSSGYTLPKPLIPVDGIPMFQKAMSSFSEITNTAEIVCVVRQEHVDEYQLDAAIKSFEPRATVIVIPRLTQGAAETAFLAKDVINPESGLIIMDCDLEIVSPVYNAKMKSILTGERAIDGVLPVFPSDDARYSYAKTNESGTVIETAEKKVISHNAIAGAYGFASAQLFFDTTAQLLQLPIKDNCSEEEHLHSCVRKEYYISYVFSMLLRAGKQIEIAPIETLHSFGTPEELQEYEKQATHT